MTKLQKLQVAKKVRATLLKTMSKEEINLFFLGPYRDQIKLTDYHHTMGRYIRNTYGLWNNKWTPVIVNGIDESPDHPDVVSREIIEIIWKMGPKKNG